MSKHARVSEGFLQEVRDMQDKLKKKYGLRISQSEASEIILKKSKATSRGSSEDIFDLF